MAATGGDMDFWELVKADKIQEVSHMLKHTHRLNIDILGRIFHDSPLMVAIKNGNIEMMQLLIDNGADCNLKCSDPLYLGHTPLFFATKTLHACGLHMMKILIMVLPQRWWVQGAIPYCTYFSLITIAILPMQITDCGCYWITFQEWI